MTIAVDSLYNIRFNYLKPVFTWCSSRCCVHLLANWYMATPSPSRYGLLHNRIHMASRNDQPGGKYTAIRQADTDFPLHYWESFIGWVGRLVKESVPVTLIKRFGVPFQIVCIRRSSRRSSDRYCFSALKSNEWMVFKAMILHCKVILG